MQKLDIYSPPSNGHHWDYHICCRGEFVTLWVSDNFSGHLGSRKLVSLSVLHSELVWGSLILGSFQASGKFEFESWPTTKQNTFKLQDTILLEKFNPAPCWEIGQKKTDWRWYYCIFFKPNQRISNWLEFAIFLTWKIWGSRWKIPRNKPQEFLNPCWSTKERSSGGSVRAFPSGPSGYPSGPAGAQGRNFSMNPLKWIHGFINLPLFLLIVFFVCFLVMCFMFGKLIWFYVWETYMNIYIYM